MAALLKILIIVLLIWQGFKLFMRFVMPFAMRKLAERLIKRAQNQAGSPFAGQARNASDYTSQQEKRSYRSSSRKEGAVQVDFVPPKKDKFTGKGSSSAGEFVEFEEIK